MTAVPSTLLHDTISSGNVFMNIIDTLTNDDTKSIFMTEINDAYEKMTIWRKNLFQLPKGRHGKKICNEMTKQIDLWCINSPFRKISMKCLMIMPNLLLQRT